MIVFTRRPFNGNRILFRYNSQDFLILRSDYGGGYQGGQSKRKMDRYFVVLIRDVFRSIRIRTVMWIFGRCFPRVVALASSSNTFTTRITRTNGDETGRQIDKSVARSTFFMRLLRSNFCQDSVARSAIFKRGQRGFTRDIRHMFRHNDVSRRFQFRLLSLLRDNRTMNIMCGPGLVQISIRRNDLILRAWCIDGRKTRLTNSRGWGSRGVGSLLFVSGLRLLAGQFFISNFRSRFRGLYARTTLFTLDATFFGGLIVASNLGRYSVIFLFMDASFTYCTRAFYRFLCSIIVAFIGLLTRCIRVLHYLHFFASSGRIRSVIRCIQDRLL